ASRTPSILPPRGGAMVLAMALRAEEVRLGELVTAGGCAAKYPAARLEELLAGFVPAEAENLLVGLNPADDAAVYRLDDERAVVGTVRPDAVWQKSTARPGDTLFLTKPLGTGLVLHGHKRGLTTDDQLASAVEWMRTLNRDAADALRPFAPSAVTDVTGFGLL